MVEDVLTGEYRHVASAYLTYVAVDMKGNPLVVPQLAPETEHQKRRFADAGKRRELNSVEVKRKKELRASLSPDWYV
jgi:acyl-CoA hydrolase